jgi:formylglycine-generating enzyme required for sulfatase activity/predicted Ser/Thr protein kinase
MNAPRQALYLELSDADQQKLEVVLEKFERAWTAQSLAQWMKEWPLKLDHLRFPALVEMVKIDLERRWQVREPRKLEFYLTTYPELGTPETVVGELVETEMEVLRQHGERVNGADYQRRFPGRDAELSKWLSAKISSPKPQHPALKDTAGTQQATPVVIGAGVAAVSLPEHFGRYRILKTLGEGGMGSVFLAHDTELKRDVAIKVPHIVLGASAEVLERFQREAHSAATLQHPNLCPIYDVGIINETHYISMAYIRGRPLSDFVSKIKRLSPHAAALVVRKLAKTLDYAHKRGIIHRDLKPSNVMMDEHNQPIVMDFGLARKVNQSEESRMTSTGVMLGSPAYMPPEQVMGQLDRLAAPTDIYSLGVIFYELLTGDVPFPGTSALAVATKILTEEPRQPSELREGIDPELEHICLKMMAKKIEDRYATAQEAAEALTNYLKSRQKGSDRAATTSAIIDREEQRELEGLKIQIQTDSPYLSRLSTTPSAKSQNGKWMPVAAIGLAALIFGVIFLLNTPKGTIQVELEDPSLKVIIDGETMSVEDLKSPLSIKTGTHTILVEADGKKLAPGETLSIGPDGSRQKLVVKLNNLELSGKSFEIRSGANPILKVSWIDHQESSDANKMKPPLLAKAPFTHEQAKSHQEAWAKHLRRPVESTNGIGMKFVLIPPGEFLMGAPDSDLDAWEIDKPQHRVRITKPFYMGRHEVTVAQFRRFVDETDYRIDVERDPSNGLNFNSELELVRSRRYKWRDPGYSQEDNHPVVFVSWNDAEVFCRWLSRKEQVTYRLPTEAEWEYACRAGTQTRYWTSDDPGSLKGAANVVGLEVLEKFPKAKTVPWNDGYVMTSPVGQFKPNPFGLYDMLGNVQEWCRDAFDSTYYARSPVDDPQGPLSGWERSGRGGCMLSGAKSGPAKGLGCNARDDASAAHNAFETVGFRIVCEQAPPGAFNAENTRATPSFTFGLSWSGRADEIADAAEYLGVLLLEGWEAGGGEP